MEDPEKTLKNLRAEKNKIEKEILKLVTEIENRKKANDNIEDLDSSWIQEFQNLDNEYKNYYTEELSFIRIHSAYVNCNNEIEKLLARFVHVLAKPTFPADAVEKLKVIQLDSFTRALDEPWPGSQD